MPVYTYEERWDARPASTDTKAGQSLQRSFWVVSDTPTVSGASIIAALAVLEGVYKGAEHPEYPLARCTKVEARPHDEEAGRWDVTASYEEPVPTPGTIPEIDPETGQQGGTAPTDQAPRISCTFRKEEVYQLVDLDDEPFINTAGDPLQNPPPVLRGVGVIEFEKNYAAWNIHMGMLLFNMVNSEDWEGFPPESLLITGINAAPVTEAGYTFWRVKYQIEYKPLPPAGERPSIEKYPPSGQTGGWNPTAILDAGYNYINSESGTDRKVAFTDDHGQGNAAIGLLNGTNGRKLGEGEDPKYIFRRCYARIDFADL